MARRTTKPAGGGAGASGDFSGLASLFQRAIREDVEIRALEAERSRLHGVDPSRPRATAALIEDFVAERGIAFVTAVGGLPSLAEAIVGRAIHGSWMADEDAHLIYGVLGALSSERVIQLPLARGVECAIAPALAPVVQRIAIDPDRVAQARQALSADATALLERLETLGELRMDSVAGDQPALRRARVQLQNALLVSSVDTHTERGRHTALVRPWSNGPLGPYTEAANALSLAEAEERLWVASIRAAVIVREREARTWFRFAASGLARARESGAVRRVVDHLTAGAR